MTDAQLRELLNEVRVARTDLAHVEVKRAKTDCPKRIWETLSAFANSPGGGVIILGADEADDFALTGVDQPKKVMQDLASLCAEMEPRLSPPIAVHRLDGATLVVAEVQELLASQKPCYHRASGLANGVFLRVGDADRHASAYEVHVLMSARGQPEDDAEPVPGARLEDLDAAALAAFTARVRVRRARFRDRGDEAILQALKVLVPCGDAYVPSLAGLLVFGGEPQAFLPQLAIVATAYPGSRKGELGPSGERQLDDRRIEGPLRRMVADALQFVQRNARQPRVQAGAGRTTPGEIPVEVLSEALVNALAHRDLSRPAQAGAVQVEMFADRLEIVNPGGLHGPVNVDSLGLAPVSSARNRLLMQMLEDAPDPATGHVLVEHRGSGVGAMVEALRNAEMSPPRFDNSVSTFRVVFARQSLTDAETAGWLRRLPARDGLSRHQQMALTLMRAGERVTVARYRQLSGDDTRVAARELGDLARRGLAEVSHAGRWTSYVLASALRETAGHADGARAADAGGQVTLRPDRRGQILALLGRAGPLPRARIQQELGLSQSPVNRWLRILLREGKIVGTADKPEDPGQAYALASTA